MARDITVSFDDGSSHVYRNAPDNITPDQAFARAQQDFAGKNIINLDGGRGIAPTAQAAPMAPKEPTPQEQSIFRQVADVPLQFATGVTQGVRMIADAFGAGNPLSKSLRGVEDYIGALYSAQSKQDAKEIGRIMKEAEDKGVADQVLAGVKAFSVAPVDTLVRVFGNAAPAIAGGLAGYLFRGGAAVAGAIGAGTGATMGAGSVKGSIYDATKQVLQENTKMSPEQIEKRAVLAQEYGGKNLDQILMGAALGTIGSTTGIEPLLARQLAARIAKTGAGRILEKEAVEKAEREAAKTLAKRGAKKQAAITAAEEMATEFPQEFQEQVAQNVAQQREGFNVPTYRGATAAGTLGALSAIAPGGAAGARAAINAKMQGKTREELESTPEGRQIIALDELVRLEEKKARVEELKAKETQTKADKSEVAALEESIAETPVEELTKSLTPADSAAYARRLREMSDEDFSFETSFSHLLSPEQQALIADEQAVRASIKKEDEENAAYDARLEEANRQAKNNFNTAIDQVNSADYNGDLDAALDAYRTKMLDTLSESGEKDEFVMARAEREFDRLAAEHKKKTEAKTEETPTEEVKTEETPTEEVKTETPTEEVKTEAPAETAVPVDQKKVNKQIKDSGITLQNGDSADHIRDEWVDPNTNELFPEYDYYAGEPSGMFGQPHGNLRRVNTLDDVAKAEAEGLRFFIAEKPAQATADELHAQVRDLEEKQQALLSKNGRVPNAGTKKRQQWDELGQQIADLKQQRDAADSAEKQAGEEAPPAVFSRKTEEERQENFDRWFGASETVDGSGNALVLYTGTSKDVDFPSFKVSKNGVWLTTDPFLASMYAEENDSMGFRWEGGKPVPINTASRVIPVYARIEKPYTMTVADIKQINTENYKRAQGQFFDKLRAQGYDGVNMGNGVWVVLNSPNQIKSAIGNDGNYSLTKPSMVAAPLEGRNGRGLHPEVAEAIRNNDLNGALQAMIRHASGFPRELALRLAQLKLPSTIVVGRQRDLTRKLIDVMTAQQQVVFFRFINQKYPDVYDKYFKDFDRAENLERVMDGLQELGKPKYKLTPVDSEYQAILKAFADTVPYMDAPGMFIPRFDVINLNPSPENGTTAYVFLHEVVHAATEYLIRMPAMATSKRQIEALSALNSMFVQARAQLPPGEYAFESLSEFVAEAMTNRAFQNKLKTLRYRAKVGSLYTRFVNAIGRLLGFDNMAGAAAVEIDALFNAHRPKGLSTIGPVFVKAKKDDKGGYISPVDPFAPGAARTAEDVQDTLRARADALMKGHMTVSEALDGVGPALWTAAGANLRAVMLPFLQLQQLQDLTKTNFPQLGGSIRVVREMTTFRGQKIKRAEDIVKKWQKMQEANPRQSMLMNRIMLEATVRGVELDPEGPSYSPNKMNLVLQGAWEALNPEFQQLYRDVRDYYADSVADMVRAMKDRTKHLPEPERKAMLKKIDEQFGPDKLVRPYFPLRRFGDFWFQVGKGANKEFYMFESKSARNLAFNKRRKELMAGDALSKDLATSMQSGNSISNVLSTAYSSSALLENVKELVDEISTSQTPFVTEGPATIYTKFSNEDIRKELNDSLNQMIYLMLPQQSMRKMFINRRAVQGMSSDMLRVFAQSAVHSAYQQARFKYAEDFINSIRNAAEYVRSMQESGMLRPLEDQVYRDYIHELEERVGTVLGIEDKSPLAQWVGRATEATFFYMLSAPASAIMNVIGMHAVTMPYIGGRYGYKETNALMLKNMGRYLKTVPTRTINPLREGNFYSVEFPSIVEGAELSPLLRRAADRFVDSGQINISTTNDAFNMAEQPSAMYTGRWNAVKRTLGAVFHQAERFNREITLLTTFELAYNKLKNEPKRGINGVIERDSNGKPVMRTEEELFEDAIDEANEVAALTLGDFTRQMKGRAFTKPLFQLLLQFKQYAVLITYALARNLYLAMGAPLSAKELETMRKTLEAQKLPKDVVEREIAEIEAHRKETYKEARRRLYGILGMAFLYGGAAATPFFMLVSPIMRMFGSDDDDDEFYDPENDFYNKMEAAFGNAAVATFVGDKGSKEEIERANSIGRALAHAITRGTVATAANVSLADRVSINPKDLWFREGRFSSDARDSVIEAFIANLGPFASMMLKPAEAARMMDEGNIQRAFETMLPALFAKPLTSYRYGTEGLTNRQREVVGGMYADQFTATMLATTAIGFPPESVAMVQKSVVKAKEKDQRLNARYTELMNRLWMATEYGSDTEQEDAMDTLLEFGSKYPAFKVTQKKIQDSFAQRRKARAEAEAIGAKLSKPGRPYTEEMIYQP